MNVRNNSKIISNRGQVGHVHPCPLHMALFIRGKITHDVMYLKHELKEILTIRIIEPWSIIFHVGKRKWAESHLAEVPLLGHGSLTVNDLSRPPTS